MATPDDVKKLHKEIERLKAHIRGQEGRGDLISFTEEMMPGYECAKHHRLIADKLMAVERGEIKRLMIFMPPRSGKSTLASIYFPSWYIGKNPTRQIITASYSGKLSEQFSRKVRNTVGNANYTDFFPTVSLSADSKAKDMWHTSQEGVYIAVGVQGAATGNGADLLLIDDPVRDAAEADSELIRDKVWDWFSTVAYTRLQPNGAIVVIMTRWHEDDLSGRLLEDMEEGGQQWDILRLPAIAEHDDVLGRKIGEALWPEWYPINVLEETRDLLNKKAGQRFWSAMYQQNPVPDDGDFFKAEWIRYYDDRPKTEELTIYATSDYAVTDKGGDFTVHMVFGIDQNANIYVLDCYRAQASSDEWIEVQISMMKEWKPIEWVGERGQIESSVGPFLRQIMKERGAYCNINSLPSIQSKTQRAQSIRGRTAMGKLYFPRKTAWTNDIVSEMMHFPRGKNDDCIDTLSLMGRILDTTWSKGFGVVSKANTDLRYGTNIIDGARKGNMSVVGA